MFLIDLMHLNCSSPSKILYHTDRLVLRSYWWGRVILILLESLGAYGPPLYSSYGGLRGTLWALCWGAFGSQAPAPQKRLPSNPLPT